MKKDGWFKNLPLILLAAAIALSPSFSAGTLPEGKIIEIRAEDILIVILGLVWIANFLISGRKRVEKPPLFFPILVWLGIGFFSLLTNWIFGNLGLSRGFFYFLKEIEFFFLYFYLFYHIKSIDAAKFIVKTWIFLGLINVGYVIYQIVTGSRTGEYGTAAISEWGVFPTGAFFLIIFIFLVNIWIYYFFPLKISVFKKITLAFFSLSPIIGVVGSMSKTNFLGLILAIFLIVFFWFFKKRNPRTLLTIFGILVLIITILIITFQNFPLAYQRISFIFNFANLVSNYSAGRWEAAIKPQFEEALNHPFSSFFGFGKGAILILQESHNQYLRNFIETGLIGSLIFLILIFAIIKKSWYGFLKTKDPFLIGLSAGLLIATITMLFLSLATEPFIIVKPSGVYWFFAALTMATLSFTTEENYAK